MCTAVLVVLLVLPFYLDAFWLRIGALAMAAAVGAIGLDLLVGIAGQVSLAHALFVGVGAYGYVVLSADGADGRLGIGLPPVLGVLGAVLAAAAAGGLVSPIASRVRGLYLAVVTIGLVFVGQHVLDRWTAVSGGYAGRPVPELTVLGVGFGDGERWQVLGVAFGAVEKLWLLTLAVLVAGYVVARRIADGRPGIALSMIRESEVGAAAFGVPVRRAKGWAFVVAALYGGVCGVLVALVNQFVVPASFTFQTSVDYLIMIIVGGLGSVRGAIAGAVFVSSVPLLLQEHAGAAPFLAPVGEGGIDANVLGVFLYGGALVLVLMFAPRGLDAALTTVTGAERGGRPARTASPPVAPPAPAEPEGRPA